MSEKQFERLAGQAIDRQIARERDEQISAEARRHFSRPARKCELCGNPMNMAPDGSQRQMSQWESKWSVHEECAKQANEQLDRQSKIASERRR